MIPVICPIFGHREQADACVEHLRQQSMPTEIMLLDSNDDPATFTHTINYGLRRVLQQGDELVMIIHPDVTLEPTTIEQMVAFMGKRPTCGIATPLMQLSSLPEGQAMGGGLDTFPYGSQRISDIKELSHNQKIHWAAFTCVLLRTETIRQIGLLDENMAMICSDSDYCFTARTRGWKIWRVGKARAWHEYGQSDPPLDPRLEQIKLQDMLYFGRKWLTADLYRDLAYEGQKCTPQWIEETLQEFDWALQTLETRQPSLNDKDLPHLDTDLLKQAQQAHRQGDLKVAEELYRKLLERKCHHPAGLHGMGLIAYQQGRHDEAVEFFDQAIEVQPETAAYHLSLAMAYQQQDSHALAIQTLQEALRLNSELVEAWQVRAVSLSALGHIDQGIEDLKQAVSLRPDSPQLHIDLGRLLARQQRPSEAVVEFKQAVSLRPDLAEAHFELAQVYRNLNDLPTAYRAVQNAIDLLPQHAGFHSLMAAILQDQGLLDDALDCSRKVIELMPDRAEPYYNLACLQRDQGHLDDAIASHQQAIDRKQDFAEAHWGQTICHLLAQHYPEAWQGYHWRHHIYTPYPHPSTTSQWQGQSFKDQVLMVHCEQRLSDTLHWLRLLPQVKTGGGTVVLAVWHDQVELLQHTAGIDHCIGFTTQDPPRLECDWVASLLDLPGILGATPESYPLETPLLYLPSEATSTVYDGLGTGRNIGIVLTGVNDHHSTDLRQWIALIEDTQATFFLLQAEPVDLRDRQLLNELGIHCPFQQDPTLYELASLISQLDLVIAVDSPVLLLSAILNRPTWGLIATSPDWRWLLSGDRSPWYPKVSLYRQTSPTQWHDVFARLINDLKKG